MAQYRMNTPLVEARKFEGSEQSAQEIIAWAGPYGSISVRPPSDLVPYLFLEIRSTEGMFEVAPGDYVLVGAGDTLSAVNGLAFARDYTLA